MYRPRASTRSDSKSNRGALIPYGNLELALLALIYPNVSLQYQMDPSENGGNCLPLVPAVLKCYRQ